MIARVEGRRRGLLRCHALSAPRRLRAVFRLLWVAVCALAIGGLAAELWLQSARRAASPGATSSTWPR
jgi:hypothetical protein